MAQRTTASCFCGSVQLEVPTEGDDLTQVFVCHCTDCRKLTASVLTTAFVVKDSSLKHLRGEDKLTQYSTSASVASGNTMTNFFCKYLDNTASVSENGIHDEHNSPDQTLPPVDGGLQAWRVLLAAFMFEAILWGFPLSFGIFQEYYSGLPEFDGSPFITYIGSIATGIVYMGAPSMAPLVKKFPMYQRHMVVAGWIICLAGWIICLAGMVAGSFADSIGALIVTQGVMYGVGYLIIFYPVVSMVNEWWVARRGLAWGILLGSSGASGVAYPFIIEALLHKYGYKITLRAMASLGFYLPSLYLPSYAATAGLESKFGAMLIALMNVSSVLGQFTYGYLSDGRFSLNNLLLSTMLVSTIVALALWGFAKSLAVLVVFALIYGFFAYAFLAMRVRMGTAVASEQTDTMTMFCLFSFAQGIGNVLAGPISGALLSPEVDIHGYGLGKYKALVIFTGCAMFASAGFSALAYLVPMKRNTR
ncbi:MFS general substrate transporter [Aureobasidium sp. EXF-12298]|nr:MFS general substrate transporter [Aureobasidium sp. EXF-12298]